MATTERVTAPRYYRWTFFMAAGVAPTQLEDMTLEDWFRRQMPGWRKPLTDEQGNPLEYGLLNIQVPMGAVLIDLRFNMPDSKVLHNETWYREVFPHGRGLVPAHRGPVLVETTDPNPSWAVLGSQLADDYEKRLVFAPPPVAVAPAFEAKIGSGLPTAEELRAVADELHAEELRNWTAYVEREEKTEEDDHNARANHAMDRQGVERARYLEQFNDALDTLSIDEDQ